MNRRGIWSDEEKDLAVQIIEANVRDGKSLNSAISTISEELGRKKNGVQFKYTRELRFRVSEDVLELIKQNNPATKKIVVKDMSMLMREHQRMKIAPLMEREEIPRGSEHIRMLSEAVRDINAHKLSLQTRIAALKEESRMLQDYVHQCEDKMKEYGEALHASVMEGLTGQRAPKTSDDGE